MEENLSPKQKIFAEHYALTHNATAAAIKAGYAEKTARQQAYNMKKLPEVAAYIDFLEKEACTELNITRHRILAELEKMAFSNMKDYVAFNADGVEFKDSEKLTEAQMSAVSEVSMKVVKGDKSIGIKLYSKLDALKTLAAIEGHNAPVKTEGKLEIDADVITKTVYSNKLRVPDPE